MVLQIAQSLSALHSLNIAHRRLQTSSIAVSDSKNGRQVKLLIGSFEMAMCLKGGQKFQQTSRIAAPALIPIQSPEVKRGLPYGIKTDIWALGMMAFSLLTGAKEEVLYQLDSISEPLVLPRHSSQAPSEIWEFQVSPEAQSLIQSMTLLDQNARPTVAQLLAHPWLSCVSCAIQKPMASMPQTRSISPMLKQSPLRKQTTHRGYIQKMKMHAEPMTPSPERRSEHQVMAQTPLSFLPVPSVHSEQPENERQQKKPKQTIREGAAVFFPTYFSKVEKTVV